MKEAILYTSLGDGRVKCDLCAHRCTINDGKRGKCGVRKNNDGTLVALSYNKVVATHLDPIEKKPLFHFKPASKSFSIATVGCNFKCDFCQNHDISQWVRDRSNTLPGEAIAPNQLAEMARSSRAKTIAFTYTEPTIFSELAYETAIEAEKFDIDSVWVSNGYMTSEMQEHFGSLIKGINIDLKTFNDKNYRNVIGGKLDPVLETIARIHEAGVWVEITTLIIPDFNDSIEELRQIADFIAKTDPDIPWHISAFHPDYNMTDRNRTDVLLIERAYEAGKDAGLNYIYTGNLHGDRRGIYFCPACKSKIIDRIGFNVIDIRVKDNKCQSCGEKVAGVFDLHTYLQV